MVDLSTYKIGFLGFGNMAQAIAKGFLAKGTLPSDNLYASARNLACLEVNTSEIGIHSCQTNKDLIEQVDMVVLSVKPHQVADVIDGYEKLLKDKVVVSIAVGILYSQLTDLLLEGTECIAMMPNQAIQVAEGAISLEAEHSLSIQNLDTFMKLFEDIAVITTVTSDQMGVAGVVNGCGPAFTALFIEAMGDAAVKYGLSRHEAYKLASQTIKGTAQQQLETDTHPGVMKDAVTSPAGTTIKGISALEKNAFRSSIIQAFDAILEEK